MKLLRIAAIMLLLLGLLSACSLKKNTAASRNYMAFITRYNIYFNGDEHYKTTLKEMEEKFQDDYTTTLLMHPAEARGAEKAPEVSGDFTRSIEKAQKAIQLRSIKKRPARKAGKGNDPEYKKWLKREEYNPFLHNAWMMMARSQYMNGDFLGAASTFFYISKHFTWLPATVTEARLWQARSYCAIDWLFEAESILTRIKESELTTPALMGLYNFTWADYYVRSHRDAEAIPFLQKAIDQASGPQRTRLRFLLGQLYQATGQTAEAYATYGKISGSSSAAYRAKFNARIKQSEVFTGSDIEKEVKALRAMTRPSRNKEYLDQIYYAIGNLYLSRGDTVQAIDNYKFAVAKSTRNGIDKSLAQITLGKLYFAAGEYNLAQPCYAEAVPSLPETYTDYRLLKRQSDVLDELSVYAQNVELQDSLLELSELSPEEQRAVADRLIAELRKREREEAEAARREQYLADQAAKGDGLNRDKDTKAPTQFVMNTDNSWYFYNEATRNAGRTAFQKRWGSRRLEDDWRRRNKASFSTPDTDAEEEESAAPVDSLGNPIELTPEAEADREAKEHESDPHYPEYYLKQIPSTAEEKQTANEVIRDGLYNMGLILKDKLSDFGASEREFAELMRRYPDNPYRLEVYNNLFLMYLRQGDMARAEQYRSLILSEFPDSKFAEALKGSDYLERLLAADSIQAGLYDRAYEAYMNNDNQLVHRIYSDVRRDYPLSRIMPKFMFINALAYVTENDPTKFGEQLHELVEKYPDTDVAPLANDYIRLLNEGRKLNSTASNLRGMVWSTRLTGDSATVSMAGRPTEFVFSDSVGTDQLFVFLFPTDVIKPNQLLFEVARFNFNTFTVRDFDLEPMTFGPLGLIVVKGFTSQADVDRYRTMMEQSPTFTLPPEVIPVAISQYNFDVLLGGRSFEEYFEAIGDHRLEQTHREVLPEDEYPSAEEMYDTEGLDEIVLPEEDMPEAERSEPVAEPVVEPEPQPEPEPEPEPVVEPEPEPAPAPVTKPAQPAVPKPQPKPAPKPQPTVPKPAPKPQPKPAPAPVPAPAPLPDYPEGSEGDDPLLD